MNNINDKRLSFIKSYKDINFYQFKPSLFKQYYMDYPKQDHPVYEKRIIHKIRMVIEYLRGGYRVFYMEKDGKILGHIVVANGGRRLTVSKKNDIVIGPIFVSQKWRGKGIGTISIDAILNELDLKYRYAYEFIMDNNIASIRTVEKNGYQLVGRVKESGILKKMVECPDGNFVVYRYSKNVSTEV